MVVELAAAVVLVVMEILPQVVAVGAERSQPRTGGDGGSGIVGFLSSAEIASQKATGGAISEFNGKIIHTFYTSGTFTNTSGSNLTVDHIIIAGGGAGGGTYHGAGGGAGGVHQYSRHHGDSQVVVSVLQMQFQPQLRKGNFSGGVGTPSFSMANGGGNGGGHMFTTNSGGLLGKELLQLQIPRQYRLLITSKCWMEWCWRRRWCWRCWVWMEITGDRKSSPRCWWWWRNRYSTTINFPRSKIRTNTKWWWFRYAWS